MEKEEATSNLRKDFVVEKVLRGSKMRKSATFGGSTSRFLPVGARPGDPVDIMPPLRYTITAI